MTHLEYDPFIVMITATKLTFLQIFYTSIGIIGSIIVNIWKQISIVFLSKTTYQIIFIWYLYILNMCVSLKGTLSDIAFHSTVKNQGIVYTGRSVCKW